MFVNPFNTLYFLDGFVVSRKVLSLKDSCTVRVSNSASEVVSPSLTVPAAARLQGLSDPDQHKLDQLLDNDSSSNNAETWKVACIVLICVIVLQLILTVPLRKLCQGRLVTPVTTINIGAIDSNENKRLNDSLSELSDHHPPDPSDDCVSDVSTTEAQLETDGPDFSLATNSTYMDNEQPSSLNKPQTLNEQLDNTPQQPSSLPTGSYSVSTGGRVHPSTGDPVHPSSDHKLLPLNEVMV